MESAAVRAIEKWLIPLSQVAIGTSAKLRTAKSFHDTTLNREMVDLLVPACSAASRRLRETMAPCPMGRRWREDGRAAQILTLPRLDLDQPQDHVGVILARPAHGPHAVDDGRLDLDEAFALVALHGPPSRAFRQRRGDGVIGALGEDKANHLRMRLDPGQAVISGLKPSVSVPERYRLSFSRPAHR